MILISLGISGVHDLGLQIITYNPMINILEYETFPIFLTQ